MCSLVLRAFREKLSFTAPSKGKACAKASSPASPFTATSGNTARSRRLPYFFRDSAAILSMRVPNCSSRCRSPGYSTQKASIDVPTMTLRGGRFDVLASLSVSPSWREVIKSLMLQSRELSKESHGISPNKIRDGGSIKGLLLLSRPRLRTGRHSLHLHEAPVSRDQHPDCVYNAPAEVISYGSQSVW